LRTQFIYLFGARIFASAAQAAVLLILARVVSVNSFGILNSALAVGLLAVGAADFGASTLLAKAQAKGDHVTVNECVNFPILSKAANTATAVPVAARVPRDPGHRIPTRSAGDATRTRRADTVCHRPVQAGGRRTHLLGDRGGRR
jgi:hypothetical protein